MELKPISNLKKDKRGMGIQDLFPAILIIALVAILIAIVLFVLGQVQEQMPEKNRTIINESFNYVSIEANHTIDYDTAGDCFLGDFTVWDAYNLSDGAEINSTCYTHYANTGNIVAVAVATCGSSTLFNGSHWNVSYYYSWGGEACEATESTMDEIVSFVPWIGIILLIIAAAVILGILIRNLGGGRRV